MGNRKSNPQRQLLHVYEANVNLLTASKYGDISAVEFAITHHQANVNFVTPDDDSKRTCLHCAAENGHHEIVEYLLTISGININQPDEMSQTALHIAASEGHLKVVRALLEKKAHVHLKDKYNYTATQLAYYGGHDDVIQELENATTSSKHNVKICLNLELIGASERGEVERAKKCIEEGADVNYRENIRSMSSLHHTAMKGHSEIASLLLDEGADVIQKDSYGRTALHLACENVSHATCTVVDIILKCKNTPMNALVLQDDEGNTPLHVACQYGLLFIIDSFLSSSLRISPLLKNNNKMTAIELLPPDNSDVFSIIVHFLDQFPEISHHIPDDLGIDFRRYSLYQTLRQKHISRTASTTGEQLFSDVLDLSEDASKPTDHQPMAISSAPTSDTNPELSKVEFPPPLRPQSFTADTVPETVSRFTRRKAASQRIKFTRQLSRIEVHAVKNVAAGANIQAGVDLDAKDQKGRTPLCIAASKGHHAIVAKLLQKNKNTILIKDKKEQTALHLACLKGHLDTVQAIMRVFHENNIEVLLCQDSNGDTPFHLACSIGHVDIVRCLTSFCQIDANPCSVKNKQDLFPIDMVREESKRKQVLSLFQDKWTNTAPVHTVPNEVDAKDEKPRLDFAQVDIADKRGLKTTPLHIATEDGNVEAAEKLIIKAGKELNSVDKKGKTPLHIAASKGHHVIVLKLFQTNKADIHIKDKKGRIALHFACRKGHLDVVKTIMEEFPENNKDILLCQNNTGDTPFHLACQYGHLDILKVLIEYCQDDTDPNSVRNEQGLFPIDMSSSSKQSRILELFHEKWPDSRPMRAIPNEMDTKLLKHTRTSGKDDKLIRGLKRGSLNDIPEEKGLKQTQLHVAIEEGNIEKARILIESEANLNAFDRKLRTPLHIAAAKGHYSLIAKLLKGNAVTKADIHSTDQKGRTALHVACSKGYLTVVQTITEIFPENNEAKWQDNVPNKKDEKLLKHCNSGSVDEVKNDLRQGASVNVKEQSGMKRTPLHIAVEVRNTKIVQMLIDAGAKLNVRDQKKQTPLHIAATKGDEEIVRKLLEGKGNCKPDMSVEDQNGWTPLHYACFLGHSEVRDMLTSILPEKERSDEMAKMLWLMGAAMRGDTDDIHKCIQEGSYDINCGDKNVKNGMTPLMVAAKNGHSETVSYLLKNKADLYRQDMEGRTALHLACENNQTLVVGVIVNHSRMIEEPLLLETKTKNGDTPLHYACRNAHTEIINFLVEAGVNLNAENANKNVPIEVIPFTSQSDKFEIIGLFEKQKDRFNDERLYCPDTHVRVFVCGKKSVGKTLLAKTIPVWACQQNNPGPSLNANVSTQVSADTRPSTIAVHNIFDVKIGHIAVYDFPSHTDYAGALRALIIKSPSVFVLVLNLNEDEEDLHSSLHDELKVIENISSQLTHPSQLIIVGSHLNEANLKKFQKLRQIVNQKKGISKLVIKGSVGVQYLDGEGSEQFLHLLSESCKAIVIQSSGIDFQCYKLYTFLQSKLKKIVTSIEELCASLQEHSFTQEQSVLEEQLTVLSKEGLIQFQDKWVIVNQAFLLDNFSCELFSKSFATNTGMVLMSVLKSELTSFEYDLEMLIDFMLRMEYCVKIDPGELKELNTSVRIPATPDDKMLHFPQLLKKHHNLNKQITEGAFGWCAICNDRLSDSSKYTILLQLAYKHCDFKSLGRHNKLRSLNCTLWRNGICWEKSRVFSGAAVQINDNRDITVVVSGEDKKKVALTRSSIISLIRQLIEQLIEFIVFPDQLDDVLAGGMEDQEHYYFIESFAYDILLPEDTLDERGEQLKEHFGEVEPYYYLCPTVGKALSEGLITDSLSSTTKSCLQSYCKKTFPYTKMTDITKGQIDKFSVFAERNPFEIGNVSDESLMLAVPCKHCSLPSQSTVQCGSDELDNAKLGRTKLLRLLAEIRNQWQEIGLALNVHDHILSELEQSREKNIVKLSYVLQSWIDGQTEGPTDVTWDVIIEAVKGDIVNNPRVAEQIRQSCTRN